ncbi:TMEM175 family protein [Streptomyces sp. NPDC005426]|uniref:TMEM175 family protein n=1 Tax=Streptomyces sp. NPDC005426 TaxID=3155344 RepID=UPI0033B3321C
MTLLVLDITVPPALDEAGFDAALAGVWPSLGAYALSFAVLAGFWRDQRSILHQVRRCGTLMVRVTLAGLGLVALLPFPTSLLSEYGGSYPAAVAVYAVTIAGIALLHLTLFLLARRRHAGRRSLRASATPGTVPSIWPPSSRSPPHPWPWRTRCHPRQRCGPGSRCFPSRTSCACSPRLAAGPDLPVRAPRGVRLGRRARRWARASGQGRPPRPCKTGGPWVPPGAGPRDPPGASGPGRS